MRVLNDKLASSTALSRNGLRWRLRLKLAQLLLAPRIEFAACGFFDKTIDKRADADR
jgi:hypothetical protein